VNKKSYTTKQIRDEIEQYYYYSHIQAIYHQLLKPMVQTNKNILKKFGVRIDSHINKAFLLDIFSAFIADHSLRNHLFESFSSDTKKVLEKLSWRGTLTDREVSLLINQSMIKGLDEWLGNDYQKWIEKEFKFFCFDINQEPSYGYGSNNKISYDVFLPPKLRSLFKVNFKRPAEAILTAYETLQEAGSDKDSFIFQQGEKSPNELQLAQVFYQQGLLNLTKQNKPAKASIKKMQKALECQEYYTDTATANTSAIHSNLLALITIRLDLHLRTQQHKGKQSVNVSTVSGLELSKIAYKMLIHGNSFSIVENLLLHLRNRHHIQYYSGYDEAELHKNLLGEINKLLPLSWVNFGQWENYLFYNDVDIQVINRQLAKEYLYCDIETEGGYYRDKEYVNSSNRMSRMVITPLIKSCLFLYASLGLIDISYTQPFNPYYQLKNKDYLSIYDGLECFRLTELGAYILGQINSYEVKEDKTTKARLIVDEQRLLISFHGKDMLKQTVLNQMTHKVGDNHYKMDFESLMSGCSCISEVEKRIEQFKQQIIAKPPENWQLFFKQVIQQANPLKQEPLLHVFKLNDRPMLYQLIASDPILRKIILKAENYHIVIDKNKLSAVKKRLLNLGYFV